MKDQNPDHLGIHYSHPWQYFLLVYILSAPFWLLSLFIQHSALPDNLPLTDIGAALTPTIAAALLRYREGGNDSSASIILANIGLSADKTSGLLMDCNTLISHALFIHLSGNTSNRAKYTGTYSITDLTIGCLYHVLYCRHCRRIRLCRLRDRKFTTIFYATCYSTDHWSALGIVAFAVNDSDRTECRTHCLGTRWDNSSTHNICLVIQRERWFSICTDYVSYRC